MFVERFGVRLLRFSFLFIVLLNLSFHLLFNIIGSSPAWFVSKKKIPLKSLEVDVGVTQVGSLDGNQDQTSAERGLPFEFQVLELALEAVCLSFHSSLSDLNKHARFVLDELTKKVSTSNLERVRSLKRDLTTLLAGVHKVLLDIRFFWSIPLSYFFNV